MLALHGLAGVTRRPAQSSLASISVMRCFASARSARTCTCRTSAFHTRDSKPTPREPTEKLQALLCLVSNFLYCLETQDVIWQGARMCELQKATVLAPTIHPTCVSRNANPKSCTDTNQLTRAEVLGKTPVIYPEKVSSAQRNFPTVLVITFQAYDHFDGLFCFAAS